MATLIKSDLEFILQGIKISEAHAGGGQLSGTGPNQVSSPLLPFGMRTVDGRLNNLIPGQPDFGAADTVFPRLLTPPVFRPGENLTFDPDGPGPIVVTDSTSYQQTKGIVEDSQPRTISNLIVDMTADNPAAVAAAAANPGAVFIDHDNNPDTPDQLFIPNRAPDEGLSAPFNSWFTLFGQFFDHGLDLLTKGNSGTVFVPLKDDDPLIVGADGIAGTADDPANPPPPDQRFMVLTRATNLPGPDGIVGDNPATPLVDESADDVHEHTNTTTPFVDQNQTYTSHSSHQVFLREYVLNAAGDAVSNGRMLDSPTQGGLATWADVKDQAAAMLGIQLSDQDVLNVPLLRTDQYGKFIPGPNGFAQFATTTGFVEGVAGGLAAPANVIRTGHAFLDDIAHLAVPFGDHDNNPGTPRQALVADLDALVSNDDLDPNTYDDELLDAHFITGDGRGNENIGLTTVHHVFHSEHNRQVAEIQATILATGDAAFIAEWELAPGVWNGERVFQAARFATEMQYQHLVFEEFARKVQPEVNVFAGYETDINPAIVSEFAHQVYRFGHSMLTETVARTNPDGSSNDIGLIQAFLNPLAFTDDGTGTGSLTPEQAAGAVVRGMTGQVANEIDEFVTEALRNNLLGLPLDLPTINMARGRDTGVPSLNAARREFFAETSNSALAPYDSWADFGLGIRHPESLVNFIAAYGTHGELTATDVDTLTEKRAVATALVMGGSAVINAGTSEERIFLADDADRSAFLNSTGAYVNGPGGVTTTGLDAVDLWMGGLAEAQMPFGGLLGSTFNFVFETQMEKLQDGDRFYYLSRTAGLNFLTELENNSFAQLVMNNTDTVHLPGDVFSTPDFTFEAAFLGSSGPIPDDPHTPYDESTLLIREPDGTIRFNGGEHIVMGGTDGVNDLRAGIGDDTIWGDGGNDRLEGGAGNDGINGGDGDDIITDLFGIDNIKGGAGNDVINAGPGTGDLILGGFGKDFVVAGADPKETFGGGGDDFIIAGDAADTVFGNEGSDWLEGGSQADLMQGENGAPFQDDAGAGHDVLIGDGGNDDYDSEGGDDIMVTGGGIERNEGMLGFDWVTATRDQSNGVGVGVNADMFFTGFMPPDINNIRDRFDLVEGLSGWSNDDILRGDSADATTMIGHELNNATQIGLISGLQGILGAGVTSFSGGNIILGGDGSDLIEGRGGNDLIDGDSWLNVRLSVRANADGTGAEIATHNSMTTLQAAMFAGTINPGQIVIVREILPSTNSGLVDIDTVEFSDNLANYDFVPNANTTLMSVVHARGTQIDGADTLKNIERLKFADQTIEIVAIPNSAPATGTVDIRDAASNVIDTTPTENQLLRATQAFTDLDGIQTGTIQYNWQVEDAPDSDVWITIFSGVTFTPGDAEVGARLRAVAIFQDNDGTFESINSVPTAAVLNVNDVPTGAPVLDNTTPREGQVVTAVTVGISDLDGLVGVTFTYQWQSSSDGTIFNNIAGATNASFTPGQAQVGQQLRVAVSFIDNNGTAEQRLSAATSVVSDIFVGTAVADTWTGTSGDDIASGLGGIDTLNGMGGNDLIAGGAGNDIVNGGDGDDTIQFAGVGGGFDAVNGGAGADRIEATASNTNIGLSSVVGVEQITGGAFSNVAIRGSGASNTLNFAAVALTGIVNINANGGNDTVTGSIGNDTIIGGSGNDTLSGGDGDDVFQVSTGAGFDVVNGGDGTDRIEAVADNAVIGLNGSISILGVEEITANGNIGVRIAGSTGNNTMDFSGTTLIDIGNIDGGAGNDTVMGSAGNDVIIGGSGNDTMKGGLGDDTFRVGAGAGADVFNGGDGAVNPLDGTDRILATATNAVITTANFGAANSIEEINANGFGGVQIRGTSGVNTLDFSGATLIGITRIDANGGNDTVIGSAAADTIVGGAGKDNMTGFSAAADIFDFNLTSESGVGSTLRDVITDFLPGTDKIDLSTIDPSIAAGDQAFAFIGSAAFSNTGIAELRAVVGAGALTGYTQLLLDTDDALDAANMEILLAGTPTVTSLDFVL